MIIENYLQFSSSQRCAGYSESVESYFSNKKYISEYQIKWIYKNLP